MLPLSEILSQSIFLASSFRRYVYFRLIQVPFVSVLTHRESIQTVSSLIIKDLERD